MKIENFDDLEKLFDKCQKAGVLEIRLEEVYIKFGSPPDPPVPEIEQSPDMPEMSDDELIFYSVKDQET